MNRMRVPHRLDPLCMQSEVLGRTTSPSPESSPPLRERGEGFPSPRLRGEGQGEGPPAFTLIELLACQPKPWRRQARSAFTLIELLVVISLVGLIAALLMPALRQARESARGAACASNLRQIGLATQMYLDDYGRFFPYFTTAGADRLLYFGLESPFNPGGAPGTRHLDLRQAKLYPYLQTVRGVEVCPSYNYHSPMWRQKFDQITYGYGLNLNLFGKPLNQLTNPPARVVCFVDTAQVNTFQSPASASNPMLEEFYYASSLPN